MDSETRRYPYFGPIPGDEPPSVERNGALELQPGVHQAAASAPGTPPGYVPVPNQPAYDTHDPFSPIIKQPTAQPIEPGNWINMPQTQLVGCPPGLEYLTTIDQLLVHQKVDILEVLSNIEIENKFHVRNSLGQDVYFALEESNFCARQCCGPSRPFAMKIYDNYRNEVIHLNRPLACQCCCSPCCLQGMEVSAPPGSVVGSIQQEWSICYPTFAVKNINNETVLRIKGPCCTCACGRDVEFRITTPDGTEDVGKITKQWGGYVREMATDADNFGITFPMGLDVYMKATLLGALFLIDAMYYEGSPQRHR